jgi:hypothetical protein
LNPKREVKRIVIFIVIWFFLSKTANIAPTLQLQPSPEGIAKIYGHARYIDRNGEIGYIRRARVELWEDTLIDTRLALSQTDDSGYYEFHVAMTGSKNVYAKILCQSYIVSVTYGIFDTVYSYKTPINIASEDSTTDLGYYYAPSNELWWQAMDYATDEFLWIEKKVNWVRSQVHIKYPEGSWPTSYGNIIELPDPITCQWDRATVLHEYAHCVMYALYGYFPQGSCSDFCQCGDHHKVNSVSDEQFAFYEGWADFMQSAVDDNPHNTHINNLGDVLYGSGYPYWSYTNIESNEYTVLDNSKMYRFKWYHGRCPYKPPFPGCPSFNNNGNAVEGAVAGIFWDIYDPANDDQLTMGFYPIWYVLSMYKPESMIEFLDYWPYTGVDQQLCDICLDHGIAVFDDLDYLFYDNTFLIAGDTAYCTDVLGSAKTSFGLAKGGVLENPEGRTDRILTEINKDTGNLITVGGPAVSPLADDFDDIFGITYQYNPGVSFQIRYHDKSIHLNLADYPRQDICIIFLGEDNSRSVMIVWGYGWEGTYAGSTFIGDPNNWVLYQNANMLMLRWIDYNGDGLVHKTEVYVEQSISLDRYRSSSNPVPPSPVRDAPIEPDSFGSLPWLFYSNTFFVAGDTAYCTDVLGSAKIAFGLAKGGAYENPEGRTDRILTGTEHNTGNLIIVGGPAVNPVANEVDTLCGITYSHIPGVSFEIHCEGRSIYLNLGQYPTQDICIVYTGVHNSRNVMVVWGYGWEGTYAGSMLMGDPAIWQTFSNCHMLLIRWRDFNGDKLVSMNEITVEQWI